MSLLARTILVMTHHVLFNETNPEVLSGHELVISPLPACLHHGHVSQAIRGEASWCRPSDGSEFLKVMQCSIFSGCYFLYMLQTHP